MARKWRRGHPAGLIHNIGGGSSLVHDLTTAHASHYAWVRRKFTYKEWQWVALNPIHWLVLTIEAWNYRNASKPVIAVSDTVRKQLEHYHPQLKPCIHLIRNGYGINLQAGVGDFVADDFAISRPAVKNSIFTICTISNNHRHKGIKTLLEALEIARKNGEQWHLEVFGEDPRQQVFEALSRKLGVEKLVVFKGHTDAIVASLQTCHLYCGPSKYESFGMSYLDAVAAGIPCLATSDGVYAELVAGVDNFRPLVHPVLASDLYAAIRRIKDSLDLQQKLVAAGRSRLKLYDEKNMAGMTVDLYEELYRAKCSRERLPLLPGQTL